MKSRGASSRSKHQAWLERGASTPQSPCVGRGTTARATLEALRAAGRVEEAQQLADALARGDVERVRGLLERA